MSSVNFKVIFNGRKDIEKENLTLTFKKIDSTKDISISNSIVSELKNLSEKSKNIVVFQNIDEVIEIGNVSSRKLYNYFYVLIYIHKLEAKKEGFLIGNLKKKGDVIIGVWPFNKELLESSPEDLIKTINDLIKNPHEYSNISLILS